MPDNLALRLRSGTATPADVEYAARCVDAILLIESYWVNLKDDKWRVVKGGGSLRVGRYYETGHATALEAIEEAADG